jgi:hypothetical protein
MTYPCFTARTFEYTISLLLFFSSEGLAVTQLDITELKDKINDIKNVSALNFT